MHKHNIIHFDIKADNIMLSEENYPILVDYGEGL